ARGDARIGVGGERHRGPVALQPVGGECPELVIVIDGPVSAGGPHGAAVDAELGGVGEGGREQQQRREKELHSDLTPRIRSKGRRAGGRRARDVAAPASPTPSRQNGAILNQRVLPRRRYQYYFARVRHRRPVSGTARSNPG